MPYAAEGGQQDSHRGALPSVRHMPPRPALAQLPTTDQAAPKAVNRTAAEERWPFTVVGSGYSTMVA
jgi:hypothetical protein